MKAKELSENRAKNLQRILNHEYDGDKSSMAAKLEIPEGTLRKYLNHNSDRPCGFDAARRIERRLALNYEYLDFKHYGNRETYYVFLTIDTRFSYETIELLQQEESIQECHSLLGDEDLLLKINIENHRFLDMLLSDLSQIPGFKKSRSYPAIESLSWQRAQPENMKIHKRKENLLRLNGIDSFIHKKSLHYYSRIKALRSNNITVQKTDIITLHNFELIRGVKNTLYSTRYLGMHLTEYDKYLEKERELIKSGVEAKRIITLSSCISNDDLDKIREEHSRFKKIGCSIKFIIDSEWRPTKYSITPEYFIILDNNYVAVRREDRKMLNIGKSPEKVSEYKNSFMANWKVGRDLKYIEKYLKRKTDL